MKCYEGMMALVVEAVSGSTGSCTGICPTNWSDFFFVVVVVVVVLFWFV